MSDFDDNGRRIPDQDELALAYEQRKRSRPWRCVCPEAPFPCAGPSCPYASADEEPESEMDRRAGLNGEWP